MEKQDQYVNAVKRALSERLKKSSIDKGNKSCEVFNRAHYYSVQPLSDSKEKAFSL